MILGSEIPSDPKIFIQNCLSDASAGHYAKPADQYLDFLAAETEIRHPSLFRYVKVLDRQTGTPRFSADADHIIPRSMSTFQMFWRDKQFNRRDNHLAIKLVKEDRNTRMSAAERREWLQKWISIFLLTKQDEGVLCTADVSDPRTLDELIGPSRSSNWMAFGTRGR